MYYVIRIAFVIVLIWIFWGPIQAWYVWIVLRRSGVSAQASVISREQRGIRYFVTYRFEAAKGARTTVFNKRLGVHKRTYQRASEGAALSIRYLPANPKLSQINGDTLNRDFTTLLVVGILLWMLATYAYLNH